MGKGYISGATRGFSKSPFLLRFYSSPSLSVSAFPFPFPLSSGHFPDLIGSSRSSDFSPALPVLASPRVLSFFYCFRHLTIRSQSFLPSLPSAHFHQIFSPPQASSKRIEQHLARGRGFFLRCSSLFDIILRLFQCLKFDTTVPTF